MRLGEREMEKTLDKIVALSKSRGFVYPGSEIYGGLANTWDYGNLGVELKNKGMVAEVCHGESAQCGSGLCHFDESPDMGRIGTSRWIFGSLNGLQGMS